MHPLLFSTLGAGGSEWPCSKWTGRLISVRQFRAELRRHFHKHTLTGDRLLHYWLKYFFKIAAWEPIKAPLNYTPACSKTLSHQHSHGDINHLPEAACTYGGNQGGAMKGSLPPPAPQACPVTVTPASWIYTHTSPLSAWWAGASGLLWSGGRSLPHPSPGGVLCSTSTVRGAIEGSTIFLLKAMGRPSINAKGRTLAPSTQRRLALAHHSERSIMTVFILSCRSGSHQSRPSISISGRAWVPNLVNGVSRPAGRHFLGSEKVIFFNFI